MQIKVSELKGKALDYSVAQVDPFCVGLEWREAADGLAWVGYGNIDDKPTPCAYLSIGSCISERSSTRSNNCAGLPGHAPNHTAPPNSAAMPKEPTMRWKHEDVQQS